MDSPASKAFADRLARYAYDPSSASPARTRPARDAAASSAGPSTPTPKDRKSSPVSTRPSVKRKRTIKDDDDYVDDVAQHENTSLGGTPSREANGRATSSTPGKTTSKTGKKPRPFAGPEVYAHLKPVTDHLRPDLDIVFCGINPGELTPEVVLVFSSRKGKMSSTLGHHFAHPTNKFWKSLHQSGITDRLVSPREDHLIPQLYNLGLTNLCDRPTSEQSELSSLEMRLSVYDLTVKILAHRPRVVCFVGKKIWDIYESVVLKTAGPPVATAGIPRLEEPPCLVKLEDDDEDGGGGGGSIKTEPVERGEAKGPEESPATSVQIITLAPSGIVKVEPSTPPKPLSSTSPRSPSSVKPKKPAIDWTQPRGVRLAHGGGYTYFWVTPNTSGLERTPLAEQVQIYTHLRHFAHLVNSGQAPAGLYREIDIDGVQRRVDSIRATAITKGAL